MQVNSGTQDGEVEKGEQFLNEKEGWRRGQWSSTEGRRVRRGVGGEPQCLLPPTPTLLDPDPRPRFLRPGPIPPAQVLDSQGPRCLALHSQSPPPHELSKHCLPWVPHSHWTAQSPGPDVFALLYFIFLI